MPKEVPEEKYPKERLQAEGIEFIGEVKETKKADLEKYITVRYRWITESRNLLKDAEDVLKDPNLTAKEKERVIKNIQEAIRGLDEGFDIEER